MQYKKLGNSELIVSQIALGTWGLGGGSVWSDKDSTAAEAERLLDACREQGINYIDTAPVYGTGESEELLGAALRGRRHDFILQSKCSLNWRGEGGNFHYSRDGYTVNNDTRPWWPGASCSPATTPTRSIPTIPKRPTLPTAPS